jgi:hypothetical protein
MMAFSDRLIAHETKRNGSSEPDIFAVVERLRPTLATLLGSIGFGALLSRALVLARVEVDWPPTLRVKSDGSFEGLDELEAQIGMEKIAEGRVVLLAQLLGLLVAFIGEPLTLRLLSDAWPKLPLNDMDFSTGDANEKCQ